MRLLGFDITRSKQNKSLAPPFESRGGWFPILREGFTGAWQRNIVIDNELALSFHAAWTCITLIAHDISKLEMKLKGRQADGTWQDITNPAYSPVLRDPNSYQNSHQFWESWILSKLISGNTYVLKERDARNVVTGLHVLDPHRVKPLVADDGSIFYQLNSDNLAGLIGNGTVVPARELIHDRWNCLFHPLVGHSPLFAAGLSASMGLRIQRNSDAFFANKSNPSGLLTAPGTIDSPTADRLKAFWDDHYSGENSGGVAVVGDDLKFQPLTMTAVDAQLIEQSRWSAENICGIFHVPTYKAGLGLMPAQTGIEQLNLEYYSQCLQKPMEDGELCLDEGLALGPDVTVEFDVEGLARMDSLTKINTLRAGIEAAIYSPNEARLKVNLGPVPGGESPYLQQQYYSLADLSKRPAPASTPAPPPIHSASPPAAKPPTEADAAAAAASQANALCVEFNRGLRQRRASSRPETRERVE